MLSTIEAVNSVVNNFIWGVPAMICIIGVGLYLSIRTRFLQIRKFPYAMKVTLGRMMKKKEASDGALTPFQAVCTALAATVGTGNVAGVAGAIAIGGPGAVFWMWISALLGMCTKFAEVTLAVHFRETNAQGDLVGGPMYYIKNGLDKKWHFLAYLFAAFGVLAVFGTGNATQVNTITTAIDSALSSFNVLPADAVKLVNLIIGVALAIIIALILIGGIKRIGNVTSKLVPFMAIMYIVLALGVIFFHIKSVPAVFASIIEGAFHPASVTGGVVGSFFMSMKKGVSRGIFSNEAGLGTGSIAHACADTKKPVKQGFFGIFEVFVDTIIICTMTALVILCSGVPVNYGEAAGAELTISGFTAVYGSWVSVFTAVAMCCFAFSTIIGWGLYGTRCIEFLFGSRSNMPFMVLYSLTAIVGATMNLGLMWSIAETFNGLMVIPNLIAVFLLSGVVVKMTKEYFAKENGVWNLYNENGEKQGALDADEVDLNRGSGLAFAKNGKWGFATNDGSVAIEPEYDGAKSFSGGVAAVCKDGKWGFINGNGTLVIDYLLAEATYFDANGICPARTLDSDVPQMISWRVERS